MTDETKIRAAWEAYHGGEPVDGYIPAAPPTYSRGYRDGYEAARAEAGAKLALIRKAIRRCEDCADKRGRTLMR